MPTYTCGGGDISVEVVLSPKFHSQAVIGQTGEVVVLTSVSVTGAWWLLGATA